MLQKSSKVRTNRGAKNIVWIEKYCRIPEGPDIGKPVKLRPWQKREIKKIYDNPSQTRRAIVSFGRKNAKTTLSAFLLLLHLCGPEARYNSQLFSAAQSKEQAGVIFSLAAKIVRMSPDLRQVVVVRDTAKQLFCPDLGSLYRALSADVPTAFGLSPVFIVHDELGQVRGSTSGLYEALETATGAQENPLSVIISTQAPTDTDLLSILIDDAITGNDPCVTLSLYTAPRDAEPFKLETIKQANPALGDFLNQDEVMSMAADAERMPSREPSFRNLVLNQRVEADNPFITKAVWETCGDSVVHDFGNAECFAGLDLSSASDLTAFVRMANIDGRWHVKPTFWLPADGIRERSRTDHVPYDVWWREGHIQLTPGRTVEYEYVAEYLFASFKTMNLKKIAFDRWGFQHLRPWLLKAGFNETQIEQTFVEFGQGYQSMSPALRSLEAMIMNRKIVHGNNPVMAMCARNSVVTSDPAGNRKLNKARSRGRIDGMIALAMATALAETAEPVKEYQVMFV